MQFLYVIDNKHLGCMHYNNEDKILNKGNNFLNSVSFFVSIQERFIFGGNQQNLFIVFSMLLTVCFKFNFATVNTLQLVEVLVYAVQYNLYIFSSCYFNKTSYKYAFKNILLVMLLLCCMYAKKCMDDLLIKAQVSTSMV